MKKKRSTKSALILSFTSLLLCFAMLIGTTFAWFTDTASTAVNKIQSGTLDVQMLDADTQESIEGQTLSFRKADGAPTNEAILWEPGCTYELPGFVVKNNGNLALKYKLVVNGVTDGSVAGDAKLMEALEWKVAVGTSAAVTLAAQEGELLPGVSSEKIVISAHMKEDAGNEYQNLSITGIGITVAATQMEAEFDSFNNTYDAGAWAEIDSFFPLRSAEMITRDNRGKIVDAEGTELSIITITETVTPEDSDTPETIMTATVPVEAIANEATEIVVTIDDNAVADPGFSISGSGLDAKTLEINVTGLKEGNTAPVILTQNIGAGIQSFKLYHRDHAMTAVGSAAEVDVDQEYYYDPATGNLTLASATFSPFTYEYKSAGVVNGKSYFTQAEVLDAFNAASAPVTLTLTQDMNLTKPLEIKKDTTIIGNGHKLTIPNGESQRTININDSTADITLSLKDLDVVGPTSGGYTRGISAYNNSGNLTLILDHCSASANYYAINIAGGNSNVDVTIKNGTFVGGWCAFQTWSSGTKATFENCTLIGNNDKTYNAEGWNNFATVVINEDATDTELTFRNCRIEANQTTGNVQDLLSVRATGAKVTLDGCTFYANGTKIAEEDLGGYLTIYYPDLDLTIDGEVIPIG